eukprot:TRINITY_DN2814_c0_g3_i2.p2 TRINITY_DN2814_c0_g3~~TRINITY_DN2814_c0_g3_i2.p2  ORF type:complete len:101 (-),score=16.50 TRINITY_DN2814_c0_g3_i2:160-462(-)
MPILVEIQEKIYENFPKVKREEEEERLSGAKIYISNICFKYNIRNSIEGVRPNLQKIRESLKNTKPVSIDLTNVTSDVALNVIHRDKCASRKQFRTSGRK